MLHALRERGDRLLRVTAATPRRVRISTATDREAVTALLAASRLPVEDLEFAHDLRFWVAERDAEIVGAIGLERFDEAALVRSLVVATAHRGSGLGRELVSRLEEDARRIGVELLVLLTQTAEPFFAKLGYGVIDRSYVPDEVKESAEFRSLCPASAVCMTKSLVSSSSGVRHG